MPKGMQRSAKQRGFIINLPSRPLMPGVTMLCD